MSSFGWFPPYRTDEPPGFYGYHWQEDSLVFFSPSIHPCHEKSLSFFRRMCIWHRADCLRYVWFVIVLLFTAHRVYYTIYFPEMQHLYQFLHFINIFQTVHAFDAGLFRHDTFLHPFRSQRERHLLRCIPPFPREFSEYFSVRTGWNISLKQKLHRFFRRIHRFRNRKATPIFCRHKHWSHRVHVNLMYW